MTPNGSDGGIWQAGGGPAADSDGNIYILDGNGTFDSTLNASGKPSQGDYGNAFLKISTSGGALALADYFATYTNAQENAGDVDLGSGGPLVLPDMTDSAGNVQHLALGSGKDRNIYLVDRENLGQFSASGNAAIYQEVGSAFAHGVYSTPAFFNNTLYYGAGSDHVKAFPFQNARLGAVTSQTSASFGYPGISPSISASGNSNGIVWGIENDSPAVLHAFLAANLSNELYSSSQAADARDQFGIVNNFVTPTIASARVYVAASNGVAVFGLLDQSTLTPLEIWRNSCFGNPSSVGAGADDVAPAHDGVPNLCKYALGLNPWTAAAPAQLPSGRLQAEGGESYLTMTVQRASQAPGVTYVVEVSGDLQSWSSGSPATVTLTNTPALLVVRDNVPFPSASERFIRLRITCP